MLNLWNGLEPKKNNESFSGIALAEQNETRLILVSFRLGRGNVSSLKAKSVVRFIETFGC